MERAYSAIQLSLADVFLREIIDEDTTTGIWLRLESQYMTKSLTNYLYMKQRLYTIWMKEVTLISNHLDEFNRVVLDDDARDRQPDCSFRGESSYVSPTLNELSVKGRGNGSPVWCLPQNLR